MLALMKHVRVHETIWEIHTSSTFAIPIHQSFALRFNFASIWNSLCFHNGAVFRWTYQYGCANIAVARSRTRTLNDSWITITRIADRPDICQRAVGYSAVSIFEQDIWCRNSLGSSNFPIVGLMQRVSDIKTGSILREISLRWYTHPQSRLRPYAVSLYVL